MATPSLAMIPTGFKAGKLYSVLPDNGTGDFDVTRATTATRVNEQGLIESMANNVPRLDYTDGGCPVLLTEPQSTNLVPYSEDFSNASWVRVSSSVVSGQASPSADSPTGAFKLVESSSGGNYHYLYTHISSTDNTLSIYAKKGENDKLCLYNSGSTKGIGFNLTTGTTFLVSGMNAPLYSKIEDFGNGWFRCSITNTSSFQIQLLLVNGTSINYTGDGTSGVYIFGAQLEALPYATSYIPTNGSTVTRVKDIVNNAGDVNTFNSEEGVLFVEMAALSDDLSYRIITISDGTSSNRLYIQFSDISNKISAVTKVGGSTQGSVDYILTDETVLNKIAFKYKEDDFALYVNGVEVDVDTNGNSFTANTLSVLDFTAAGSTSNFFGKTKQLKVYKSIADAQVDLPYIT